MSFDSGAIAFTHDFWLLLASALPVTAATLGVLGIEILVKNNRRNRKDKRDLQASQSDDSVSEPELKHGVLSV
jgi:hypothetical protein